VPPDDEKPLILEARAGSRPAFEELVRRHDRRVLRLALGLLGSEDEARDVYQETFLKVYRGLPRFRMECALRTWIVRVATNICLDRLRRRAPVHEGAAGPDGGRVAGPGDAIDQLADERPEHDPERALARREIARRLRAALAELAPRERLVFALRHHEGLSLREIAEILETSEETARNCLYRAHRSLRARLGDLREGSRASEGPGRTDAAEAEA
jgi:RNA polymerase sigma-70 factor (ECF subfamily)